MVLVWLFQFSDADFLQEDLLFLSPACLWSVSKPSSFFLVLFLFICTRLEYLIRLKLTKASFLCKTRSQIWVERTQDRVFYNYQWFFHLIFVEVSQSGSSNNSWFSVTHLPSGKTFILQLRPKNILMSH